MSSSSPPYPPRLLRALALLLLLAACARAQPCSSYTTCASCSAQPACAFCGASPSTGTCVASTAACVYPKGLYVAPAACANFGTCSAATGACARCVQASSSCEWCGLSNTSGSCTPAEGFDCSGAFVSSSTSMCSLGFDPCTQFSTCTACAAQPACRFCGTGQSTGLCRSLNIVLDVCYPPNSIASSATACANLAPCAAYSSSCGGCVAASCNFCGSSPNLGTCIPGSGSTCQSPVTYSTASQCSGGGKTNGAGQSGVLGSTVTAAAMAALASLAALGA